MGRLVCRAFRCGLGEFHQGFGDMAIAVRIVNACAVPGAFVVALPVDAHRIYRSKIELKYPFETDYISFVSDMYCFSISGGIGIYFSVGGVENVAVGITYLGGDHAVDKFQVTLGSPEAAGC